MLKIETRLDPREINGEEIKGLPNDADQVTVSAHWNSNCFVVINFHGRSVTVFGDELERAIRNARNHGN